MKPEHRQQLDEVFRSALQREPGERAAFLDEACAGDDALRKQIEGLLAARDLPKWVDPILRRALG